MVNETYSCAIMDRIGQSPILGMSTLKSIIVNGACSCAGVARIAARGPSLGVGLQVQEGWHQHGPLLTQTMLRGKVHACSPSNLTQAKFECCECSLSFLCSAALGRGLGAALLCHAVADVQEGGGHGWIWGWKGHFFGGETLNWNFLSLHAVCCVRQCKQLSYVNTFLSPAPPFNCPTDI